MANEKASPKRDTEQAPMDTDAHGNPIHRVPGPGPNDEGKGAAGDDAAGRITSRED
jgi:hypothetical protein